MSNKPPEYPDRSGVLEIIPTSSPTPLDVLRELDADQLRYYATRPLSPIVYDPVRAVARVAFRADLPMSADETGQVLREAGEQINEPNIPSVLASLLRSATDEPVYNHRLTSTQGWDLAADAIAARRGNMLHTSARVMVAGMGVSRYVLAAALSIKVVQISGDMNRIADRVHKNTEAYSALVAKTTAMMGPLTLPKLERTNRQEVQLGPVLGAVFESYSLGGTRGLYEAASVEQRAAIFDALCLRYLQRPQIKSIDDDPYKVVHMIRRFCYGERMTVITREEGVETWLGGRINALMRSFSSTLAPGDIEKIRQFVVGETQTLTLDRPEPLGK